MLDAVTRTLSTALLIALIACGCGGAGKGKDGDDDDDGEVRGDDDDDGQSAAAPGPPRTYEDEAGKDEYGGWRWKGKRRDCFFVVGNKCFAELDAACTAAKCKKKKKTCRTEGGGPATVSCAK
jgi:hypothetical protein